MLLRLVLSAATFYVAASQWGWNPTTPAPEDVPGNYLVVAPRVVRPGRPFAATVTLLKGRDEDHIVVMSIRNARDEVVGNKFANGVRPGKPVTVTIDTLDAARLVQGEYKLHVKGETLAGAQIFEKAESLRYDAKSLSIFVQTDKATYKPGATVKYRVVVVNPNLKPFDGRLNVELHDPNENLLSQWKNKTLEKGIFGSEFELDEDPPLGEWKITATTSSGVEFVKVFTVEKYVLPKFEVTIEPPSYITMTGDARVVVKAKYTYGKGVSKGKATLTARTQHYYRPHVHSDILFEPAKDGEAVEAVAAVEPTVEPIDIGAGIQKTKPLDEAGEAVFELSNEELRTYMIIRTDDEWRETHMGVLEASVTEELTGVERSADSATLTAYKVPVKLSLEKTTTTFKPGLSYRMILSVKQPDDTPIQGDNRKVHIQETYSFPYPRNENETREDDKIEQRIVALDSDGSKVIILAPPIGAENLRVEATYDPSGKDDFGSSTVKQNQWVEASKSPSDSFIQLDSTQDSVPVGNDVTFSIKCTDTGLDTVTAQVMSRGVTVESKQVALSNGEASVSFTTTHEHAPKSRLVVHGVRPSNNEILVDAMDYKVDGMFENDVTISMDKDEAEPGNDVTFTITAAADSTVCLLAVDQSVLLLRGGNDITATMVEEDIERYGTASDGWGGGPIWDGGPWGRGKRSVWWPWWGIGGKDAKQIFNNAGLVVLTDAWLYSEPQPPRPMPLSGEGGAPAGAVADLGPMPMAANVAPGATTAPGAATPPKPTVRTKFPETWIWTSSVLGADGQLTHKATVPDTITSWITSAFAISNEAGLGVAPETAKLRVFRPFFIQLTLPYSVKRGEQLALQVLVFNYDPSEQSVTVTLKHDAGAGYDFVQQDGSVIKPGDTTVKGYNQRRVKVAGGGGSKAVYFPIAMTKLGSVLLNVRGIGQTASDAVERPLLVEPEGFRVDKNEPLVVDLSSATSFSKSVQMNFPADAVDGSKFAEVNVLGDIMGPVLANLDKLVNMPYGCGEQNMVNFVPNIVVMKYLSATQRSEPQLSNKAVNFMQRGYQRELNYKRDDNSFSAFGNSDKHGSTWLTAFVLRSFKQAAEFITVDDKVLDGAANYLLQQQQENGEFKEVGHVHHEAMQGGASEGGVPMTSYVAVALAEAGRPNQAALDYLAAGLDKVKTEPYALAVTAYALQLAGAEKKDAAWQMLDSLAVEKDGMKHWEDKVGDEPPEEDEETRYYHYPPRSVDVEMTAYALLTLVQRNDISGALPVVRWLSSKRNARGGWSSTQDTVVALQALAAYAEKAYSPEFDVELGVHNGDDEHTVQVDPGNALLLQSYELSNLDEPVEITASGSGVVYAQVQYRYHMTKKRDNLPFGCEKKTIGAENSADLTLQLCCDYRKKAKSNMVVWQVDALSGHEWDSDKANALTAKPGLQRVEVDKDNTQMNLYLDEMRKGEQVCINMTSQMAFQVADQKDAQLVVYDYYETVDRVEDSYSARQRRSLQEVCADCWSNVGGGAGGESVEAAGTSDDEAGGDAHERRVSRVIKRLLALLF